jgi:hypothetical protein
MHYDLTKPRMITKNEKGKLQSSNDHYGGWGGVEGAVAMSKYSQENADHAGSCGVCLTSVCLATNCTNKSTYVTELF